jgi:hypothetical protein
MDSPNGATATRDNLVSIVGHIDERKVLDILALRPTISQIEEAAIWATGNGDVLAKGGRSLSGVPADIFEILTSGEEEEEPPVR